MKRIGRERAIPRSKEEWRARVHDAMRFEERVGQPLPDGADLVHRIGVLLIVTMLTGLMLAIAATPGIAIFGRAVGSIADRFSQPIGDAELPPIGQRSVVVDKEGRVLATLAGTENRILIPLKSIPQHTRDAVLAIEDSEFYSHSGVDLSGLMRALLTNVRSGEVRQGGSTITQQLVKNTLVGTERSVDRKINEARMAIALEKKMSKNQILEAYLNETYFGNGRYGIGAAAEFYFGKPASKLSIPESALLAAVIKAPERYDPLRSPKEARNRRATVLLRMADESFITREQADRFAKAPLGAKAHPLPEPKTPYFIQYVTSQILGDKRFGETRAARARSLYQAGLRIETTLDLKLQNAAQSAVDAVLDRKNDPEAALVSIDAKTGAVGAIISGRNFEKEHYDLAVQGKRQPGSTFKPFTMVAALDAGMAPSLMFDTPSPLMVKDPGTGKTIPIGNYDDRARGIINMREATNESVNTYYMQLIQRVGPQKVADMAKKLGITTPLDPVLSLTLGTTSVSPFELASAYATLANEGVYCAPFTIAKVTDGNGREIMANTPKCERRIDRDLAARSSDVLRGVPEEGTGRRNGRIGRPVTGKTGTTNNYTNAWYAGYTPNYSTVVWLGFLKDKKGAACQCVPLKNIHGLEQVFGGSLPAMIWSRFMRFAHRDVPVENFPPAPGFPRVPLPDVRGKPIAEAREVLDEAGFPTLEIEEVRSSRPAGTVLAQDPDPGPAPYGVVIRLRVSAGRSGPSTSPPPSPSPSPSPSPTPTPKPSPTPTKKKN